MDVNEKYPPWLRLRTDDFLRPQGSQVIGCGSAAGWADYGRWFALRQLLARAPGAVIDVSNARELAALARQLGFPTHKKCRDFLSTLAECGVIDAEGLESGRVFDESVFEQQQSYQIRCRKLRENGERGGRPPGKGNQDKTKLVS